MRSSHPAGRFLDTLPRLLSGHARSDRDLGVPALKDGLTNHWQLRRVRQIEDSNQRALSVLNETVGGFRLEGFLEPIERLNCRAVAKALGSNCSVDDSFEQHAHDNLQMSRAAVSARKG